MLIHECITCYRFKTKLCVQLMGNLRTYMVTPVLPFQRTCVDYAGPIYLKTSVRKNAPISKAYIRLSIHIELVNSLSTEAFLASSE